MACRSSTVFHLLDYCRDNDYSIPTFLFQVHICSHFILNGVCVRWNGWLDRTTLKGSGWIEFDEERATAEEQRLRQELATIDDRFRMVDQRISAVRQPNINVRNLTDYRK